MRANKHTGAGLSDTQLGELRIFNLYRVLEAALLILIAFSPIGQYLAEFDRPGLLKSASVAYFFGALALLLMTRRSRTLDVPLPTVGLGLDVIIAAVAMNAQSGMESGIALLLLFNVVIGSLLIEFRVAITFAIMAILAVLTEFLLDRIYLGTSLQTVAEASMFSVSYLAGTALSQYLRSEILRSEKLADRQRSELVQLAELNDLVLRRMRTGVLVVDSTYRIRLFNESAWALLGNPSPQVRELGEVSRVLLDSLQAWRNTSANGNRSLRLTNDGPEVLPRFVSLNLDEELFLLFMDDAREYSGRAEELTLASLGRLSASIAHEIRNPLSSILYAAQLLEEADGLKTEDQRLTQIITKQCQRMNGIVENVLSLARRERSQAEHIQLGEFVRQFVTEYQINHPIENDRLESEIQNELEITADPKHLHQVLVALVANALSHGRQGPEPALVKLIVRAGAEDTRVIEVVDSGPGVSADVQSGLFMPFVSGNEYGTGLGLYIAKQLCEANQAVLSYHSPDKGGSCFRIRFLHNRLLMA